MSKTVGKTKSQGWEIGVSRTLPVSLQEAWDMIMRELNLDSAKTEVPMFERGMAFKTKDQTAVEIRSFKLGSMIRMSWQPVGWEKASVLQIRVLPAKSGSTISVHHEWLKDGDQREAMRTHWTAILEGLRDSVENN